MSEELTNIEDGSIVTKSPKAVEKGLKPEDWQIALPDPFVNKSLEELQATYGETTVIELFCSAARVRFQSAVRTLAEQGKSDEEITSTMQSWKPGDKIAGGVSTQSMLKHFANLSPEQQQLFIQQLTAKQQG